MGEPQVGEEITIRLSFGEVRGVPVSMGNPHYVIFVKQFAPEWQAEAAEIGHHDHFKQGVNVELVIIKDAGNVEVRFFERGVGETQSSGTGSCASAVAAIATKRAQLAGTGSCSGRSADGPLGGTGFSSRVRRNWSAAASFSFRARFGVRG